MQARREKAGKAAPAPAPAPRAELAAPTEAADASRRRLVDGLAAAIVEKGYVATTIADIVRHARVSKRTFYEHFTDKEECFLAGYKAASDDTLAIITAAAVAPGTWQERVRLASRAYLEALQAFPALTRTYLVELYAAGPRALKLRRVVHGRFADLLRALAQTARKENPEMRPLGPSMAIAVVGGIHELVLAEVEAGRGDRLVDLADTATELLVAVVSPQPKTEPEAPPARARAQARRT